MPVASAARSNVAAKVAHRRAVRRERGRLIAVACSKKRALPLRRLLSAEALAVRGVAGDVLAFLHAHAQDDETVWLAQSTIAEGLGRARETITRAIDQLAESGFLEVVLRGGPGIGSNVYKLLPAAFRLDFPAMCDRGVTQGKICSDSPNGSDPSARAGKPRTGRRMDPLLRVDLKAPIEATDDEWALFLATEPDRSRPDLDPEPLPPSAVLPTRDEPPPAPPAARQPPPPRGRRRRAARRERREAAPVALVVTDELLDRLLPAHPTLTRDEARAQLVDLGGRPAWRTRKMQADREGAMHRSLARAAAYLAEKRPPETVVDEETRRAEDGKAAALLAERDAYDAMTDDERRGQDLLAGVAWVAATGQDRERVRIGARSRGLDESIDGMRALIAQLGIVVDSVDIGWGVARRNREWQQAADWITTTGNA
jgi:hypothetical protein